MTGVSTVTEAMVDSLFSGRYYRLNKLFMRQIGIWPRQAHSARIALPILFVLIIGSVLVPELVRLHDVWGKDTDNVIECIPAMLIISVSWAKLLNGVVKRPAILELVQRIERDWESLSKYPSSVVILKKYAEEGRLLTVSYAGFLYFATTAFIGFPVLPLVMNILIPLNESREKKYLYEAEYGVDPEKYYYYMLFHSYLTSYMCMMVYVVVDTTLSAWVQHCCALFEIVSYNLRNTVREDNRDISKVYSTSDVEYRNLCFCIKQHKDAITFANLIESTYSTSLAWITGVNMMVMSISGVLVLIKIDDFEDVLRFSVLTLAPLFHLYFNTVPGQKLIDHSQRVGQSAYQSEWSDYTPRAQRLIVLIIARAQRPCLITAGKLYLINMESFSAVMQTSISYFTAICSLRIADK